MAEPKLIFLGEVGGAHECLCSVCAMHDVITGTF